MSRPKPRYRWYLECIKAEDGSIAAHVLRCGRPTGVAEHGFWVPEDDESHYTGYNVWEPGRLYRNKRAVERAIRQLLARFPGICLEKVCRNYPRPTETVWIVGANPYEKRCKP